MCTGRVTALKEADFELKCLHQTDRAMAGAECRAGQHWHSARAAACSSVFTRCEQKYWEKLEKIWKKCCEIFWRFIRAMRIFLKKLKKF